MAEAVFRDSGFVSYEPNQDRWDEEQLRELVFNDFREHGGIVNSGSIITSALSRMRRFKGNGE